MRARGVLYLPDKFSRAAPVSAEVIAAHVDGNPRLFALVAVLIGIVLAAVIQQLTGYFTETAGAGAGHRQDPLTGPATVILAGISLGLESAVYSAVLIGAAVYRRVPARRRLDRAGACSRSRWPAPAC